MSVSRKAFQLVLNSGSSSLKYAVYKTTIAAGVPQWRCMVEGVAEGIGTTSQCRIKHSTDEGTKKITTELANHKSALTTVVDLLPKEYSENVGSIGHRVVHGGEHFKEAIRVDESVIAAIKDAAALAPLHNPWNLLGIEVAADLFGEDTPQVAVFDTAFHQTMEPHVFQYALPYELYEKHKIRKYGFHGTSYSYVTTETAKVLGKSVDELNIIACHLGNGASMCAVKGGRCLDTTMGLTPLEGLVMGTRCGDIDPAVVIFLMEKLGYSTSEVNDILNKKSGLLGICGTMDDRDVEERYFAKEPMGTLAKEVQIHRMRKYLGAYMVALSGEVDALVFTGGLGEKGWLLRSLVCENLGKLGLEIDEKLNQAKEGRFSENTQLHAENSRIQIWVIPTQEELTIAQQTFAIVHPRGI
jgi:acetate kinase